MPRGVEEKFILPSTHVATKVLDPLCVNAPTSRILESRMLCESLDPKHIGELAHRWLNLACFRKGNEKCHNDTERVRGELEQSYVKVLEYGLDEMMKEKRSSSLYDRLAESHITRGRQVRPISGTGSKNYVF